MVVILSNELQLLNNKLMVLFREMAGPMTVLMLCMKQIHVQWQNDTSSCSPGCPESEIMLK